jgi:predicted GIY-YIG superfamily endonuclease
LRRHERSAEPHLGTSGGLGGGIHQPIVKHLVWYEEFPWVIDAIKREKAIKHWPRAWKIKLIEKENPDWQDLYSHLLMF